MPNANQLDVKRSKINVTTEDLLRVPDGIITEEGVRENIRVGVQYLEAWLKGNGCVPLYNLMEDAATAEISRAQLWQWIKHEVNLSSGDKITIDIVNKIFDEELAVIKNEIG